MTPARRLPAVVACLVTMPFLVPSRVAAQDAALLNPVRGIAKAELKSFLGRPLFDQSRRLPPPTTLKSVGVEVRTVSIQPPPTLHLLGVIHGRSDMAIAQRDGEQKTTILRTGDHIGDWVLTVFPPVRVRLRNGTRIFDYTLFSQSDVGVAGSEPRRDRVDAVETSR